MGVKDRYNQKKKEAETEEEEKTGVRERYLARNGEERKESSVSDGSVTLGGKTYKKREALDVDGYEAKRKQEITAEKSAKSAASVSEQKMVLDDIGSRVLTTVQNATQKRSVNTSNLYTTEEEKKRLMALQSILDEEDKDKTEEGNKAMPSNLSDAVMEAEKNSVNPLSEQIKTFQENATPSGISEEAISYNPREWNQNAVREKIAENEKKNYEENIVPKVKAFTETAKNGTALDKAGAIATSLIFAGDSGLGSARDFLNLVKNDDGNIENTPEYWRRKSLTALRDSVQGEAIESKFGKEAYNIAYSIVDSVTESLYTSPVSYLGAGGKVASLTSAIGMGGSAALDTYIDMRERGVDSDSAKIGAFLSGVGEGLFESVSLGHFTEAWTGAASRTMKEWFVKQLVSAGVNGSEEFFTEIWDGIIDLATDPEKSKYAEFYNSGVENGGSSASGFRNAFMNGILPDAGYSFVTGAIQGGLMTAGQIGASALINGTERSNAIAEMKANGMSTNEAKKTYKIVKEIRMEAASASNDKGKISKFNQNVASVSENPVQTTENTETSAQNNAQDSQSMNVSNDTENVQTSQNAKESVTDGNANTGEKVNTDVYARNGNEVSKVDVKSIEYEKNGRAKLVSENGESVYLNETEFANEDVRDIFAIMADDKKSASEIKAASANYAESVNGRNVSVTEYLRSFTAYEEGASAGLKLEEIESQPKVKSVFSENMTDAAKTAAYNVGASKRFSKPGLTMLTQRTYRQQDASVKRQIDIIGNMAKANGLHFVITDDLGSNNGLYKENSNTIAISLDAEGYFRDSDGKKVPLLTRTAGHEVYHFVERFNEKAAADIREEVLGFIRNTRGEEYLNEIRNTYKENGYSENLIDSEITADAMFDAFSDERTVEKLVKKDRNLVEKVKEFIDKVLADIRNAIAELRKQDKVMDVFADETEELQKISSMLQNALRGAKSEFAKRESEGDSAETSRRESRKVTAEEDAEYLKLAENPKENEARLREMVDSEAKYKGFTEHAYHGTNNIFNSFDKSLVGSNYGEDYGTGAFFFTSSEKEAQGAASDAVFNRGEGTPTVLSVFINSDNMVTYIAEKNKNIDSIKNKLMEKYAAEYNVIKVVLNNGDTNYIVLDNRAVKSSNTVTYDGYGKVIPLSERFNSEDEDIRYQKKMSNGDKDKKIKSLSKEVNRLNKDNAEMKDRLNAISEDFKTADKKFPSEDKMNELSKKLIEGKKAKLSPSQISKRLVSFINNLYSGESNDAFSEAADIAFDILGDESASDILDMAEEIMRSLVNDIPEVKTSLGIRYNAARRRVIELTDTIRKNKEKYKDALVKAKDALVKANRKYEEYRENESRETYITKITDKLENLQERLDKPNVKSLKYVPTNAVNAVKTILEAFNHAEGEKVTADWQNALRSVIEGADGSVDKDGKARLLIPDKSVEAIKKFLGEVSAYEAKTGTKVTDPLTMDSSKLKELNSAIYVIEKAVSNLVYGIRGNNRKTIADTASEFYIGIPRNPLKVGIGRQYAEYNLRNMKPVYLFKAMGENGRRFFYDTLATGDERYARNIAKVQKGIDSIVSNAGDGDEAKGRKQIEAWRTHINEIKLDSGRTIYMTDMELADFYLQFGNGEDAFLHFTEGGISLSQSESDLKDIFKKSKSAYDFRRSNNEPIPLTSIDGQSNMSKEEIKEIIREKKENGDFRVSGDVARILSIVEKNNGLKSFAEDMRKYVFETLAPMGNDVTQRIWGVDLFTQGETYWSIKALKAKSLQNQVANMGSIYTLMNPSFSKSRVEGANSPIQIDSAFGGLINIGYKMSLYNGYSAEMYDFIRVLDTEVSTGKTLADAMSESLGLSQSSGMNVSKYIVKLIQDIAGASQRRDSEAFYKSWKLSNVTWNARVAVQQAMSLTRAVPYLGKYMVQNPSSAFMLKEFKEATQHSGIALEKSMEHYDTGTSRGIGEKYDMSKSAYRKTVEKISDIGLVGAEYFDKFAWGVMWNACKKKVKTENPKIEAGSKDYFAKVSDTFREVIYETQVADGVLQKSDMMRGDRFDRMLSNYMAEPTTTLNMWNDAVRVLKNKNHSKEAKSFARKRIATIIIGNTLMATVVSAFDATARDDDDDETWLEKFVQAMFGDYDLSEGFVKNVNAFFSANLVEQFNPLSYATGIFNIVNSALKGFTAESLDMGMIEGITDFIEYVEKSIEKSESLGDVAKAVWNAPAYIKKAVLGSIDMVMGGVGLKNMYRDVNFVKSVFGVESDSYSYDETGTADVLKAYSTGDTVKFRETYDKYIAEMTEEGKSLEDCQRNVRNRVWREYKAEYYEARESVSGRLYEIENIFDDFEIPDSKRNDEYFTYKREKYSLTAEDIASEICNGSTKKWNQLLDAVGDSYKDLNAEEKKDKRDNQKSAVTRFVKAAYLSSTDKRVMRAKIVSTKLYTEEQVTGWEKENE